MTEKDQKPKDTDKYMEENKNTMDRPPNDPEGITEPRTKSYRPVQRGFIIFIVLAVIVLIIGISTDMFGLM